MSAYFHDKSLARGAERNGYDPFDGMAGERRRSGMKRRRIVYYA